MARWRQGERASDGFMTIPAFMDVFSVGCFSFLVAIQLGHFLLDSEIHLNTCDAQRAIGFAFAEEETSKKLCRFATATPNDVNLSSCSAVKFNFFFPSFIPSNGEEDEKKLPENLLTDTTEMSVRQKHGEFISNTQV